MDYAIRIGRMFHATKYKKYTYQSYVCFLMCYGKIYNVQAKKHKYPLWKILSI